MYELFVGDPAVAVLVVAEDVLHDVVKFIRIFIEDLHQGLLYLFLLEALVLVGVELGKHFEHPLADKGGEAIIRKAELGDPSCIGGATSLYYLCHRNYL
jgi:hypothetical protein